VLKLAPAHVHVNKRETNGTAAQHCETLTFPGAPPDVYPVIATASDSQFHTILTEERRVIAQSPPMTLPHLQSAPRNPSSSRHS
jgi:hypothetical protein